MTDSVRSAKDLFVLTADSDMAATMKGLLSRSYCLGIRKICFDVDRHLDRDPGCRKRASEWLRPRQNLYKYAIVLFDRHGCGSGELREDIQSKVQDNLNKNGWATRSKVIVIDPELEAWVWNSTESTAVTLGWASGYESLKHWLRKRGHWRVDAPKPSDPKDAMILAMREKRVRKSSTLFEDISGAAQWQQCEDAAFAELKETLQNWFPL